MIADQEQITVVATPGTDQADVEKDPLFREIPAQLEVFSLTLSTPSTSSVSL